MRILWIGPWHADVLCQQVRGSMAQALRDAGNEITTFVVGAAGSWHTGGFDHIVYFPKPPTLPGKVLNQFRFAAAAARYRGDVIVLGEKAAHFAPWLALVRRIARRPWRLALDVRTIPIPSHSGDIRSGDRGQFRRRMAMAFRHIDGWMAITPGLRDAVAARVDTRGLPCCIWESAVDRRFIDDCDVSPSAFIRNCGHVFNILYLGSLARGRRIDLAVEAMTDPRLAEVNIGLHLVGDGDHLAGLRDLAARLNLEHRVHIWGPIPYADVPATLRACDLGILPLPPLEAWNVSSALKLYEYMGAGLPVLVSDISAHRHALGDHPFGLFMRDYSAASFTDQLLAFTQLDETRRRQLGAAARQYVSTAHTWDHRANDITRFLSGICRGESVHERGRS